MKDIISKYPVFNRNHKLFLFIICIAVIQFLSLSYAKADTCYVSGDLIYLKNQAILKSKTSSWKLEGLEIKKLLQSPTQVHVEGNCNSLTNILTIKNLIKIKPGLDKEVTFNQPNSSVLAQVPYSSRAIQFAKHYQSISDSLHHHLGEPKVITSLAFESHVVKDVALQLEKLESGIRLGKALRELKDYKFSKIAPFFKELLSLMSDAKMASVIFKYGIKPFITNSPLNWGWHHLDKIILDLESLYENMSAMNMHIFSFMTSIDKSPLDLYFNTYLQQGKYFNGRIVFPDDTNKLLEDAFYKLYLAYNSQDLEVRKKLSLEFSILLIAHEQIHAQDYYDQIKDQHKILAGSLQVIDPIGKYKLAKNNWALFNTRFSLVNKLQYDVRNITSEMILNNTYKKGTIPHYYQSRIYHRKSLSMLEAPKDLDELLPSTISIDANLDIAIKLIKSSGCLGCHKIDSLNAGGIVGPDLSKVGLKLSFNDIKTSIIDPEQVISTDCLTAPTCASGLMPKTYSESLTETEIDIMSDYLSKLR